MLSFLKEHRYIAAWVGVVLAAMTVFIGFAAYHQDGQSKSDATSVLGITKANSEPSIEAAYSFHFVSYPKSIETALKQSGQMSVIRKSVEFPEELSTLSDEQKKKLYEVIETYVNTQLGDVVGDYGIGRFVGYSSIRIRNLTTRTLEDVTLQLPYFFLIAEVYRDGSGSEELTDFAREIEFGEIRPEEDLRVTAWFDTVPASHGEEIKIFHRDGVGKVYMSKSAVKRD